MSDRWLEVARRRLCWRRPPTVGLTGSFATIAAGPLSWFGDGRLAPVETCVDRHLATRGDHAAIVWEGDQPGETRRLTYRELHAEVCRTANALAGLGVGVGDRVIIYLGMVPEAAVAMLACARVGAVHSVVFGGFSAAALRQRIVDSGAAVVITQDSGRRGGRTIPLKATADEACRDLAQVTAMLVLRRTGDDVAWEPGRDRWWHQAVGGAAAVHEAVEVAADHPLFILYTSGSTGRPKGVVHAAAGYLAYVAETHATVFDARDGDVHACVADVGWITGHSYVVYGPLANGLTTVMFESTPTYPDASRYWALVARHRVTTFYAAPTALRALAGLGDAPVRRHDRSSLRVLGSVGEPIDPATWSWYRDVVGDGRCPVVDTWWQTETGGVAISPLAGAAPSLKAGAATRPLPGIVASLRGDDGRPIEGPGEGRLCLDAPWPGLARTLWGDHARYVATYFTAVPGAYVTGDGARRDRDGDLWISGRVDDVINVAGHRMGTAELEAAINSLEAVAEVAVVGYPHERKGQGVFAFVVAAAGAAIDPAALDAACRRAIGAHARVDRWCVVPGLPKTRSGKVMRRILRHLAEARGDELGDLSTLADAGIVERIRAAAAAAI